MDEEVIPVLRVSDAVAAAAWYQRLGFAQEWEFRFEPVSRRSCRSHGAHAPTG